LRQTVFYLLYGGAVFNKTVYCVGKVVGVHIIGNLRAKDGLAALGGDDQLGAVDGVGVFARLEPYLLTHDLGFLQILIFIFSGREQIFNTVKYRELGAFDYNSVVQIKDAKCGYDRGAPYAVASAAGLKTFSCAVVLYDVSMLDVLSHALCKIRILQLLTTEVLKAVVANLVDVLSTDTAYASDDKHYKTCNGGNYAYQKHPIVISPSKPQEKECRYQHYAADEVSSVGERKIFFKFFVHWESAPFVFSDNLLYRLCREMSITY